MKSKILLSIACSVLILVSCTIEESSSVKEAYLDLPETPYTYEGMGNNGNLPTLGRVLFYDNRLSINNSVSCASCHKQRLAFADDVRLSKGFDDRFTNRNSMPIQNIRGGFMMIDSAGPGFGGPGNFPFGTFTTLFWDGREHNLRTMVLRPIFNEVEMGVRDLNDLNQKLIRIPYYQELFMNAYGTNEITSEKIATALSSFLMSITSRNTKFDQSFIFKSTLTPLETAGKTLFSVL